MLSVFKANALSEEVIDIFIYNGERFAMSIRSASLDRLMRDILIVPTTFSQFEIADSTLYLQDVFIFYGTSSMRSRLAEISPNREKIRLDFTGILALEDLFRGNTNPSRWIMLEISNGRLTNSKYFNNRAEFESFLDRQFEAFQKTEEFKQRKKELQERGVSDSRINGVIRRDILQTTTKFLVE